MLGRPVCSCCRTVSLPASGLVAAFSTSTRLLALPQLQSDREDAGSSSNPYRRTQQPSVRPFLKPRPGLGDLTDNQRSAQNRQRFDSYRGGNRGPRSENDRSANGDSSGQAPRRRFGMQQDSSGSQNSGGGGREFNGPRGGSRRFDGDRNQGGPRSSTFGMNTDRSRNDYMNARSQPFPVQRGENSGSNQRFDRPAFRKEGETGFQPFRQRDEGPQRTPRHRSASGSLGEVDVGTEGDKGRSEAFVRGRESARGRDRDREEERRSRSYRASREEVDGEFTLSRGRDRERAGREGKDAKEGDRRLRPGSQQVAERPRFERKAKVIEVQEEKKVFVPSSVSVGRLADIFDVKISDNDEDGNERRSAEIRLSYVRQLAAVCRGWPDLTVMTSEQACDIALEYGLNPSVDDERMFDILPEPDTQDGTAQPLRPPVVTIMGHVDHGKTTLLDSLRHSSVAPSEAGGITQHIGAFSVDLSSLLPDHSSSPETPSTITFLDTPGHAAFTAMRARGASVTDMIVLVVAADDGVMPQTKEVIELWKADQDKVGLVVAINKCDKPGIDVAKVKSALGSEGILLEEDGGDIPSVRVSGLTKMGLDSLVETLSTLAEIRDLRAGQTRKSEGYVLESRVDKGRGNIATVLVTKGTLTSGSCIVAGTTWARVRQMQDSSGRALRSALPGTPVSITGWKDLPAAGDQLLEAETEDLAKKAIANRLREIERKKLLADVESINSKRLAERHRLEKEEEQAEKLKAQGKTAGEVNAAQAVAERTEASREAAEGKKELRLLIKGDVSGSVEAVVGALEGIGNKEAGVKIIHTGVGEVGESDIHMAEASEATVIAFSVPASRAIQQLSKTLSVPLETDSVIYRLIETVRSRVAALLPPILETRVTGEAVCQTIFEIKLKGRNTMKVAGCRVSNGVVELKEGVRVRVLRGSERKEVFEGTIETLKHLKKDVTEVRKGTECGISFHDFSDVQEGDEIVTFTTIEVPRQL